MTAMQTSVDPHEVQRSEDTPNIDRVSDFATFRFPRIFSIRPDHSYGRQCEHN